MDVFLRSPSPKKQVTATVKESKTETKQKTPVNPMDFLGGDSVKRSERTVAAKRTQVSTARITMINCAFYMYHGYCKHQRNAVAIILRNTGTTQCRSGLEYIYKSDVTERPTLFFYRGKQSALFCCRGRIEIKYLFLWLLQDSLLLFKKLYETLKPGLFHFNHRFGTIEFILQQT